MSYVFISLFVLSLVYGPTLWVRFVLWRYSSNIDDMPGTGAELAQHLIDRFKLTDVKVKKGQNGQDYYSPDEKIVSLSPQHYDGKSLAAVAVAAHEVGHAIQFHNNEPVTHLRQKYLTKAYRFKRIGALILSSLPILTLIFKTPAILFFGAITGVATMLISVLMYIAILPEEYDASFKKALPILKEGYLSLQDIAAANTILKACALTYVAAALADIFSLWRWARFFR